MRQLFSVLWAFWQIIVNILSSQWFRTSSLEIKHYGKILNANRSYSLPISVAIVAYRRGAKNVQYDPAWAWIKRVLEASDFGSKSRSIMVCGWSSRGTPQIPAFQGKDIKESEFPKGGINAFYACPNALRSQIQLKSWGFAQLYNDGKVKKPDLDEVFLHERAIRELSHDISYRLEMLQRTS